MLKITPTQSKRVKALVKRLCCNYLTRNCLLLDDGEETKCVQLNSRSGIYCNYLKIAVLPADKNLFNEILGQNLKNNGGKKMKNYNEAKIIGIDHGYGNIKTANSCFKTGVTAYDKEPTFKENLLIWNGKYYLIGEEHKEFSADKMLDSDYYVLTLAAIARELNICKLSSADILIAAGLPLTWVSEQKDEFKKYLLQFDNVDYNFKGKTEQYGLSHTGWQSFC